MYSVWLIPRHMGTSAVEVERGDIERITKSLQASLNEAMNAKKVVVEETP